MSLKTMLLAVVVILSGCSAVGAPASPTPTPTPHVVESNVTSGTVDLDGLPIEQTFKFRRGPSAPSGWEFPIRVEFQRVHLGNWTATYVFNVEEGEPITVDLVANERYRIVVQDTNNERRVLGSFVPRKPGKGMTIRIFACCVDDFS